MSVSEGGFCAYVGMCVYEEVVSLCDGHISVSGVCCACALLHLTQLSLSVRCICVHECSC